MTASPATGKRTPDLGVSFAGIQLKNPVIAASGTFGYGIEFEDVVHLDKLGGFVVKGLSKEPMAGNPPPRLYETAAGMLNAIGLQNIGARAFVDDMRAYFAEENPIKRDGIALRQLRALREHQGPREKKLRLSDVKELFAQMKDHATFAGSRRGH